MIHSKEKKEEKKKDQEVLVTDNDFQLPKKVVDAKRKVTISHPPEWSWLPLGAHIGWQ